MSDRVEFAPDLFHGTAKDYDRFRLPYPPALVDHLLSLVEPAGNGWLLDLACGTGQLTFALLDRFARVWAVDQEVDMIEVVAAKAAARRGNVVPIVSRAEDLATPERAFEREVAAALAPYLTGGVLPDTIDFAYELARAPAPR